MTLTATQRVAIDNLLGRLFIQSDPESGDAYSGIKALLKAAETETEQKGPQMLSAEALDLIERLKAHYGTKYEVLRRGKPAVQCMDLSSHPLIRDAISRIAASGARAA